MCPRRKAALASRICGDDQGALLVGAEVGELRGAYAGGALEEIGDQQALGLRGGVGLGVRDRLPGVGSGVDALA